MRFVPSFVGFSVRPRTFAVPRAFVGSALLVALGACNQDYAASNADRETFMGNVRAAAPSSEPTASAGAASAPPAATGAPTASAR